MPLARAINEATGLTGEVALRMTDDQEMARLNQTFSGRSTATDVLAFTSDGPAGPGDIAISLDRVKIQADLYGHGIEREFGYLLTHGILHLAGRDHDNDQNKNEMRRLEEHILASVGLALVRSHGPYL